MRVRVDASDDGHNTFDVHGTRATTVHTDDDDDDATRRDATRRANTGFSSHHGTLASSRPDLGEFIERRAPHAGFLLVRGENFVKE